MDHPKQTTANKVLNRYLRQRFGFAYQVNGYLAKYLRKSGTDQNLARTLRRIEASIGQRIRVDHRGMLQWQPEVMLHKSRAMGPTVYMAGAFIQPGVQLMSKKPVTFPSRYTARQFGQDAV